MSDALNKMVDRIREDDPEFGEEYDRERARAQIISRIVEARREQGLSQRDLADETGIKQPVIARHEAGDTDPRLSTVSRICSALGLQLVGGNDSEKQAS